MNIFVEASNIRAGGGVTHLVETLASFDGIQRGAENVFIRAGRETLDRIGDYGWLSKLKVKTELTDPFRAPWGLTSRWHVETQSKIDVLVVPGGSYMGSFRPYVALAQNLLPFDRNAKAREGLSFKRLRLWLLERIQGRTFKAADGVIYMSRVSQSQIERRINFRPLRSRVVYHGFNPRFRSAVPDPSFSGGEDAFGAARPLRVLYVSILEPYKHQDKVIRAIILARSLGLNVKLDLVGPAASGEVKKLEDECRIGGISPDVVRYHGAVPYDRLQEIYSGADVFVFASSCETFGIIVLEAMAAGLPLLCSSRSALPEIAGSAAIYFDPLDPDSLARALIVIYQDKKLRESLSFRSRRRAALFSWERCARETFGFVREVYEAHQQRKGT